MNRLYQELRVRLTANPQKASVLGVLMLLLLVMGGRALLTGPARAKAREKPDGGPAKVSPIDRIRTDGPLSAGGPVVWIARTAGPDRNVFEFGAHHFPVPVEPEPADDQDSPKSDPDPSESETASAPSPEELRRRLEVEASRALTLQSTLIGSRPIAVIKVSGSSGSERQILGVGQEVAGFTLRDIMAHAIVLEKDGIRIELRRQLPER